MKILTAGGTFVYCDAVIGHLVKEGNFLSILFASFFGTNTQVETVSSNLFMASDVGFCEDSKGHPFLCTTGLLSAGVTSSIRKVEGYVSKIMTASQLIGNPDPEEESAVVFGPDIQTVKERALLILDAKLPTLPLKPAWIDWIWEECLDIDKLYSEGNKEIFEAYRLYVSGI